MRTLVLHAHPLEESFSRAIRDVVDEALTDSGTDHTVVRLAQDEEPDLDGVEHLAVVCPTWWGGPPAVALDWLQRVLGPHVDDGADDHSPFAAIHRVSVVSTHGSSKLVNLLQGEPGRQTWSRVVVSHCAPGARFDWIALYKIDRSTPADRTAFLERVRAHFTNEPAPC